jgi:hypothetical protein
MEDNPESQFSFEVVEDRLDKSFEFGMGVEVEIAADAEQVPG